MLSEVIKLYQDRKDVTLTTYILDDSKETRAGAPRPAVVICPGGAYLNCSDREAEPMAMKFLSMGYHAFVLRYSVYSKGGFDEIDYKKPFEKKEECLYPAQIRELGMTMNMLRDNADKWHINKDQIAICGFSAGAHNCAMYSVYWNKPIVSDFVGVDAEKLRPNAMILGYPLTDYTFMKTTMGDDVIAKGLFSMSNIAFLGEADPDDDKLLEISPAKLVNDAVPPTFIWATANDELVPVQHSLLFASSLADAKIPYEMHIYEDGSHGLSAADQTSASAQRECRPLIQPWVDTAFAWLQQRFAYQIPEKNAMDIMMEEIQKQQLQQA